MSCAALIQWEAETKKGSRIWRTEQAEIHIQFPTVLTDPWFIPTLFSISFLVSDYRKQAPKGKSIWFYWSLCAKGEGGFRFELNLT